MEVLLNSEERNKVYDILFSLFGLADKFKITDDAIKHIDSSIDKEHIIGLQKDTCDALDYRHGLIDFKGFIEKTSGNPAYTVRFSYVLKNFTSNIFDVVYLGEFLREELIEDKAETRKIYDEISKQIKQYNQLINISYTTMFSAMDAAATSRSGMKVSTGAIIGGAIAGGTGAFIGALTAAEIRAKEERRIAELKSMQMSQKEKIEYYHEQIHYLTALSREKRMVPVTVHTTIYGLVTNMGILPFMINDELTINDKNQDFINECRRNLGMYVSINDQPAEKKSAKEIFNNQSSPLYQYRRKQYQIFCDERRVVDFTALCSFINECFHITSVFDFTHKYYDEKESKILDFAWDYLVKYEELFDSKYIEKIGDIFNNEEDRETQFEILRTYINEYEVEKDLRRKYEDAIELAKSEYLEDKEKACALLGEIGDYNGANGLILPTKYEIACKKADNNTSSDLLDAICVLNTISSYKDSRELLKTYIERVIGIFNDKGLTKTEYDRVCELASIDGSVINPTMIDGITEMWNDNYEAAKSLLTKYIKQVSDIQKASNEQRKIRDRINIINKTISDCEAAIEFIDNKTIEVTEIKKKLAEAQDENTKLEEELDNKTKERDKLGVLHKKKKEELEERINRIISEKATIQTRIVNISNSMFALVNELSKYKEKEYYENTIENSQKEILYVNNELTSLTSSAVSKLNENDRTYKELSVSKYILALRENANEVYSLQYDDRIRKMILGM